MRFAWLAFVLVMVVALMPGAASGDSRVESRAIPSKILGRSVHYTVLLPASFDSSKTRRYPILYYLHGLGDNDQTLVNLGGWDLIEHLQETREIVEFIVVTPDGGRGFYVNSKGNRERYEDFFIQEFIPAIEQRYRALGTRATRGISGTSMGGYGALRFAFRYPNLFTSVTAHMAALAENLPRDLQPEFSGGMAVFGKPFDAQFWKANTPFALARRSAGLGTLRIYFDCGQQDDYGFDAGARSLHELLNKLGIPHEFHLYPGGHNGAYVAAHFPDSLRFHSHAFAAQK